MPEKLDHNNQRGIYLHIPFCASKCNYCNFFSAAATEDVKKEYVKALCREIKAAATGEKIATVYIGGGTPSVLPEDSFDAIFSALYASFDCSETKEITVECNPDSVSFSFFRNLKELGVNRISMGCQSFVPEELKRLGRRHTPERAKQAFFAAREAGFDNISLDLMLAVPLQTKESLSFSLETIAAMKPEHISAYILKVEEGTSFFREKIIQNDDFSADLYLFTSDFLSCQGYEHYEVSNFAQKGRRARHNAAYWQGKEYYAFGPGAYGYLNGERFSVPPDLPSFLSGTIGKTVDEKLSAEDVEREKRVLALRTSDGVKKSDLTAAQRAYLSSLIPHGFAKETPDRIALTPGGFLVSNEILSRIY